MAHWTKVVHMEVVAGLAHAAIATKQTLQTKISTLLPPQRASTDTALAQAQADLDKTMVRAGIDGSLQRPGDVVNPMLSRPASSCQRKRVVAP